MLWPDEIVLDCLSCSKDVEMSALGCTVPSFFLNQLSGIIKHSSVNFLSFSICTSNHPLRCVFALESQFKADLLFSKIAHGLYINYCSCC